VRENQLKFKKLKLKEKELSIQLKLRELQAGPKETHVTRRIEKLTDFGISKQIRFVLAFQETEVDKYFTYFEKIAQELGMARRGLDTIVTVCWWARQEKYTQH